MMSESAETGTSPSIWSPDTRTLMDSASSRELRWGRLFLLVFVINVVVVGLAWLLVGLIELAK